MPHLLFGDGAGFKFEKIDSLRLPARAKFDKSGLILENLQAILS
jgi:hypothetical protein